MAIWTMFLTVIHVFAIDLARLNPAYRMISFLALGLTLLVISWFYARYRRRKEVA
jgi:LPXTG-motif cell wall-anchored protein